MERASQQDVLMTPQTVANYVKGAPDQASQFDFLIGDWEQELSVDGGITWVRDVVIHARRTRQSRAYP